MDCNNEYHLVQEMLETALVVRDMDVEAIIDFSTIVTKGKAILTGEGSSRKFPARKVIYDARHHGYESVILTEGANQAREYNLTSWDVFVASNSGQTSECVWLINDLAEQEIVSFGLTATPDSLVANDTHASYVLSCGPEKACAATKSVVEQALFYDIMFRILNKQELPNLKRLGDLIEEVATTPLSEELLEAVINAPMIYWTGRNNGVADELALKTTEITRRKSCFYEGTDVVHGVEEIMDDNEVVVAINPFVNELQKFKEVLIDGVGMNVVTISPGDTIFKTHSIPSYGEFTPYLELVAGWNLLVEVGLTNGVDIDNPKRARKIGNEYIE